MLNLDFFTKDFSKGLDKLKDKQWYELVNNEGSPAFMVHFGLLEKWGIPKNIIELMSNDSYVTKHFISIHEALKNGPKLIKVGFQNCLALLNTEIRLPVRNYRQPYPSILVEYPLELREYLTHRYNRPAPIAGIITQFYEMMNLVVFCSIYRHQDFGAVILTFFDDEDDGKSVENHLQRIEIVSATCNDKDFNLNLDLERIVINYCMLMTNYGHEVKGWIDRKGRVKGEKDGEVCWVGLDQRIKLFKEKQVDYENKGGTHASPHPHWRSGHWRNQPYPKTNTAKQIFIAPVFINSRKFGGDIRDTSVSYKA